MVCFLAFPANSTNAGLGMVRRPAQASVTGDLFSAAGPRLPEATSPAPTTQAPEVRATRAPTARARSEATPDRLSTPPEETFPEREFEFNGGIHLVDSVLWFDADRRHDLTFISHAHFDRIGKNRRILATDTTLKILTRSSGKVESLISPFKRRFTLGQLELELVPAGHILGSSQLVVQRHGRRIVFASDVNPRKTATAEQAEAVPCDVLAVAATYGIPAYRFPPRDEVLAAIKTFVEDCLNDRANPVLIANQMGTAQELMHFLGHAGHRVRVHRSIHDIAKIYREADIDLPASRTFQGSPARDEVVIFPPILRKHASIRKLRKFKTGIVTGRAVEQDFAARNRVEAAFPLSDTADHQDLLEFIHATGASEVYLSGNYAAQLIEELREAPFRTYAIMAPEQLSLF